MRFAPVMYPAASVQHPDYPDNLPKTDLYTFYFEGTHDITDESLKTMRSS
jgi:hypothetical protein